MVKFNFKYKGKKFNIDVKECKGINQGIGLMFRKKSKPLLFSFKKPVNISIHSFFCVPFVAVWFNGKDIIDVKYVSPWGIGIKPLKNFDKFLEIPINDRNFNAIRLLIKK